MNTIDTALSDFDLVLVASNNPLGEPWEERTVADMRQSLSPEELRNARIQWETNQKLKERGL